MLQFFRINVPDRLLGLLAVLVLIRLPFILYGSPLTMPELVWQIAGEKIVQGSLLYRDLWTELAPIPAYVYATLDWLFGKSRLPYYLLTMLLVFFQAYQFNLITNKSDLYLERSFIPAIVYILLSGWFFEFLTPSPALMAATFLIGAVGKTIRHVREPLPEDEILILGFQIGAAALCYLPSIFFMVVPLAAFLLYTGTTARQYSLVIFGFLLPFTIVFLYYFWLGDGTDFYYNFIQASFTLPSVTYLGYKTILILFAVPILLLLLGLFGLVGAARITNFQQICRSVMLMYLFAGLAAALLTTGKSAAPYILLLPAFTYFTTWIFLLQRKADIAEGMFFIFMLVCIASLYLTNYANRWLGPYFLYQRLVVGQQAHPSFPHGKHVLVLGEDLSWYHKNSLATPYLNRRLAERDFGHTDEFEAVQSIFGNFRNDFPELIVNDDGTLDSLFKRMPILAACYVKTDEKKIYKLVNIKPLSK